MLELDKIYFKIPVFFAPKIAALESDHPALHFSVKILRNIFDKKEKIEEDSLEDKKVLHTINFQLLKQRQKKTSI